MVAKGSDYAVLMGDLVRSESVASIADLHEGFNAAVDLQNQTHAEQLASPLTITLGDEFQGLTTTLKAGVDIMRVMRLELLREGINCRFVIGKVSLRTPLNSERAWNMMGPGLGTARDKLNDKKSPSRYRFSLPDAPMLETLLDALGASLSAIEERWTKTQLLDIAASLKGASAAEIAKQRNVSVHSVYKVRSSGELDLYLVQWHAIYEALAELDAPGKSKGR